MAGLEGVTLDRYQLRQLVGKGGMANVYRGYDTRLEREVAIKVFKRDDEELLHRFIREAQLMENMHHPHLMTIYDTGESKVDGVLFYYIVMPFMPGGTLRMRLRRSPLSLAEACRYLREIADALDYIHRRGIIHRDIKASNILLDANGNSYLADFGIARTTSDVTQLTTTGNVLGTVDYVAPELFEPHQRADALSDLYSLGVLLFEMVTGRLPFAAENQIALVAMHINKLPPLPSSFMATLPPSVDQVVLKALEKQPSIRYASGKALAEAFCRATTARAGDSTNGGLLVQGVPSPLQASPDTPTIAALPPAVLSSPRAMVTPRGPTRVASEHAASMSLARSPRRGRQPSSEQARFRVVTVIALFVLLAVVVPITYVLLTHNHSYAGGTQGGQSNSTSSVSSSFTATATPNLTATAEAAAATATQQAKNATATAIAGMTATAQAQAQATAGVLQTAIAGPPSYSDPLNNANSSATQAANWDQDSHCAFQSDGYHVTEGVNLVNFHGCLESGHSYQDATITVDVAISSGHSGGVFFRVNRSSILGVFAGYLFEVDNQGNYKITVSKDFSNPLDTIVLQDWTASSALKTGSAKNLLQVIVKGTTFLFSVNGTFLAKIQDSTYTSGGVALLATTSGTNADVIYSNLNVYPSTP